jgi:hypothetical protein
MFSKKIHLLWLLFCLSYNVTAQSNEEVKTVFGNKKASVGKPHVGYFLSPSCQLSSIAGTIAVIPGIGAGIILNNKLSLSLIYRNIATENTPEGEADKRLYLDGQWGGMRCEYSIVPGNVIHLNFPVEIGVGDIEFDLKDSYEEESAPPDNDALFVYFEPGAALEINIWKYLKIDLAAGYRFVSNISFRNLSERDLMGITCATLLKIGVF